MLEFKNELLEFLNEYDSSVGIQSIEKIDSEVTSEIEETFNLKIVDFQEDYFLFENGNNEETAYIVYHKVFGGSWQEKVFSKFEYKRLQFKNEEESDIYKNGLDVCRLNFFMDDDNFKKSLEFMRNNMMYTFGDSKTLNFGVYSGNNCTPNVPAKFVSAIEEHLGSKIHTDFHCHYIGLNEIQSFDIGQKVEIKMYSVFGGSTTKGTVIRKDENSLHVRPYRSKSKYYDITVGLPCLISAIEKF